MRDWKKVKLGDLLSESKIVSKKPDANKRLTVRLHTEGIEKRPFSKDKKGATKYYIRSKKQFIYGCQNLHKGAFGIVPEEFDGFESSADIPAFDINKSCLPEWIYYFFKKGDFYLKLDSIAKGIGSKRINPSQIYDLDILLPTIEEQRLLLEKVAELTKKLDKAKREFDNQLKYLNQLKKSIVEDAVSGKITDNWRKNNNFPNLSNKSVTSHNTPKYEYSIEFPNNWESYQLKDLITKIEAGKSPRCDPFPASIKEWGVIKLSAISWDTFNENENKRLPINMEPFIEKEIKSGDFIMTRSNTSELVGKSVVAPNNVRKKLLLSDKTLRLEFNDLITPEYFNLFNNSSIARRHYLEVLTGTSDSMKNISQENIKCLVVSVPPVIEQKNIIIEVTKLLAECDILVNETHKQNDIIQKLFESSLIEILGGDTNVIQSIDLIPEQKIYKRNSKFDKMTILMDLVELLKKHGKLHAEDLWKMSKFPENIDAFYAELKHQIEDKKSIKEVENEKGYLELV